MDYKLILGFALADMLHKDVPLPPEHYQLDYTEQIDEQPSPFNVLPSSQAALYLMPSPQTY
jgi:hypothetical protein